MTAASAEPHLPLLDRARIQRIWLRAPNWLGDFVMATASFARVRAAFPQAEITVGLRPFLRPLLSGSSWFDKVVETPKAGGLLALWQQVRAMRASRYDLAIVLPNSPVTGLVPWLAGVPWRLGYQQGRRWLMNLGLAAPVRRRWYQRRQGPRRFAVPMPLYYRELLDVLGLPGTALQPELPLLPADQEWVAGHLQQLGVSPDRPLLQLVVGANYGASKLWMPERFAAVARHFQRQHGMQALVLVGPAEIELGERIAREGEAIALVRPVLPLDKLKALVARAALVVTGDTGPRHLAVAYQRPIVCLMGPNDPNYTDYCMEQTVLLRKELPCSPCQRKICPLGHHRCMRDITVEEVVAAGERLLGRASPQYS